LLSGTFTALPGEGCPLEKLFFIFFVSFKGVSTRVRFAQQFLFPEGGLIISAPTSAGPQNAWVTFSGLFRNFAAECPPGGIAESGKAPKKAHV
jgi:hypothetical protein